MHFGAALKKLLHPRGAAPEIVDIHARKDPIKTVLSIIFSTQTPTFKGSFSLSTMFPTSVQLATVRPSSFDVPASTSLPATIARSKATTGSSVSSIPSSTAAPTTSTSVSATVAPVNTASATPTATPAKGGMSGGAKAGLAFGIILILLLIVAGAIAIYRKRKAALADGRRVLDDEKTFLEGGKRTDTLPPFATPMQSYPSSQQQRQQQQQPMAAYAGPQYEQRDLSARPLSFEAAPEALPTAKTPEIAPQLSLRGVSTFGDSFQTEQPSNPFENPANVTASRPGTSSQANDPNNPFGQHAEVPNQAAQSVPLPLSPAVANNERISAPPQAADFPLPDNTPESQPALSPKPEAAIPAPAAAPIPMPMPEPKTSPQPSVADSAGAAAIMAATAAAASVKPRSGASTPVGSLPETVHRVQLEFKPNMPDELGIQAGQLVRILHEYDDGWVSKFSFLIS
jgi:hypothetical protein